MGNLREVHVDLDAYVDTVTLSPEIEAEVLKPLMRIIKVPSFVVRVSWPEDPRLSLLEEPSFRLIHSAYPDSLPLSSQGKAGKSLPLVSS